MLISICLFQYAYFNMLISICLFQYAHFNMLISICSFDFIFFIRHIFDFLCSPYSIFPVCHNMIFCRINWTVLKSPINTNFPPYLYNLADNSNGLINLTQNSNGLINLTQNSNGLINLTQSGWFPSIKHIPINQTHSHQWCTSI
jgi:hypothetical protein